MRGCGRRSGPSRPEAAGSSAGRLAPEGALRAWASAACCPSDGSRAAQRRGGREGPPVPGAQQVASQGGVRPSSEAFASRRPPGDAGFLLVCGGRLGFRPHVLRSHRKGRRLQENPRGPAAGVRAAPLPARVPAGRAPPPSPGRGPRVCCGESCRGRKSSGACVVTVRDGAVPRASHRHASRGHRAAQQTAPRPSAPARVARTRRQRPRVPHRELGQTETSD